MSDVRDAAVLDLFEPVDDHDRRLASSATGPLAAFNRAGLLTAADVHVATGLARAVAEKDADVVLAAALATRAVRTGSVAVDLAALATQGAQTLPDLPWPDPATWTTTVAGSRLVTEGGMVVEKSTGLAYLQRYHHQEVQVATDLRARAELGPPSVDEEALSAGLARIFPGEGYAEQRAAAVVVVRARTGVITGGPGTGKTTTVAGVLTLLAEQAAAAGQRPPRVGLAAPTGKAAARVKAAVDRALDEIEDRTSDPSGRQVVQRLREVEPSTVHRLLGWRPGSRSRFRHHRGNRLPHDVVLVDEASMVSLTQMARLLEALRPTARLILVGDADQLVSVEAGAVLADLVAAVPEDSVGDARGAVADPQETPATTPDPTPSVDIEPPPPTPTAPLALARLRTVHRFGETIGALAQALRVGDADAVVSALSAGSAEVTWVRGPDPTAYLREILARQALDILRAARVGDGDAALDALHRHRLLCAHREGDRGCAAVEPPRRDLAGRGHRAELLRPDVPRAPAARHRQRLRDRGPQRRHRSGRRLADLRRGPGAHGRHRRHERPQPVCPLPARRRRDHARDDDPQGPGQPGAGDHRAALPDLESPLLTRELFYTAVTRAQERVRVVGSEEEVRAAVERRVLRASGLRQRLAAGP
ncbi:AAA family ATPase [Serinicoccus profundi]|uniref:AAA family ATPase n=1 Tax=Serinicoccus profundi TaxID=1078471 RepID=UPI001EE89827|nr:AAA family ATPase [Serinicoccus profundi]